MIQVNGFIINEKLIKVAMPWVEPILEGASIPQYPPAKTKIIFTDGSIIILEIPCYSIYDELMKKEVDNNGLHKESNV